MMYHVVTKDEYDDAEDQVLFDIHELPPYPPQWPYPCFWWRGGIIPNCGQLLSLIERLAVQVAHEKVERP